MKIVTRATRSLDLARRSGDFEERGPRVPSELESAASDAARKASRWTQ